jgi:hypothetical protein
MQRTRQPLREGPGDAPTKPKRLGCTVALLLTVTTASPVRATTVDSTIVTGVGNVEDRGGPHAPYELPAASLTAPPSTPGEEGDRGMGGYSGEVGQATDASDPAVRLVAGTLAHALLGDQTAVAQDHVAIVQLDEARRHADGEATGLADQVLYLHASLMSSRVEYLAALQRVRKADPDRGLRRRIDWRIATDEVIAADRLLRDARHNRVAGLVNDALRPLGQITLLGLSVVNPILLAGVGLDSAASTAINLWNWRRPYPQEREALARYRQHLRRGSTPEPVPQSVRGLRQKIAAADCKRAVRSARLAATTDPELASAHLRVAGVIRGCADDAEKAQAEIERDDTERRERLEAGRWPRDPLPPIPASAAAAYHELLTALVRADPGAIRAAADMTHRTGAESLRDEAWYAETVAADLEGDHAAALEGLRGLEGGDASDSNMGRRAKALLDDPATDRYQTLRRAIRQHRRDRLRFVLLGRLPEPRAALHTAMRVGASGLRGLQTLGMLNVVGLLTRTVRNWRTDPLSNEQILAAGEEFLARMPHSPHASAAHKALADAYARERKYDSALFHLRQVSPRNDGKIAKLEEKAARRLLTAADGAPGPAQRRAILTAVTQRYPGTKTADRATTALGKLAEDADAATESPGISGDTLRADTALADQLGLPAVWFDGQKENGEVAGQGLRVIGPEQATVTVDTPDGPIEEPIALTRMRSATLGAAMSEAAYQHAAGRLDNAQPGASRFDRLIPFFIQGTVGESGVSVYPGIKPRAYTSEQRNLYAE